jgi:hypothetical protein
MGWIRYLLGTICLSLGLLLVGISLPAAAGRILYPDELPSGFVLSLVVVGAIFLALAAFAWVHAIKVTPGDDLLSDQRGLLVGLMLVTTLALGGAMLWSMVHVKFWRDTVAGMRDVD